MTEASFERLDKQEPVASRDNAAKAELTRPANLKPLAAKKVKRKQKSQITELVELADGLTFFHDSQGKGYVRLNCQDHVETWLLASNAFHDWLDHTYYLCHQKIPSAACRQDAIASLEGKARYDCPKEEVFYRVAEKDGNIYLDLGDDKWQVVEITSTGWQILQESPVRFIRHQSMQALPLPEKGGNLAALWCLLNVQQPDSQVLLTAWLLAALRPKGPYPLLLIEGEQGTSKSTTTHALRSLVDPSSAPLRSMPHKESDLFITATHNWVLCFDNLSGLPPWLSDTFCRLATGGGLSTRKLYSDNDEVLFEAQRPMILNGIDDIATRSDLLDRALVIQLDPIPPNKRITEQLFWEAFDELKPQVLGALCDALSGALQQLPRTHLSNLPRMADFALWVTAAHQALGWTKEAFISAYERNRELGIATGIDASPVGQALCEFVNQQPKWEGTALELQASLERHINPRLLHSPAWPRSPRGLANIIRRLATSLRTFGINTAFRHSNKRLICIWK
jgi:hypothetical protein